MAVNCLKKFFTVNLTKFVTNSSLILIKTKSAKKAVVRLSVDNFCKEIQLVSIFIQFVKQSKMLIVLQKEMIVVC